MALYAELFDGTRLEFPDNTDPAVIDRVAREETAKRQPKGESGFLPAAKATIQSTLGGAALLGGKLGLYTPEEAQQKFEAREAEARRIFAPTENWSDGAFTKFKELLGGSVPLMVAPLAAAGAAAALPLTGPAAVAAGLGAAGLASATQFTMSNLSRQMETAKSLDEASLGAAAVAAAPQALLDVFAFRAYPLIKQLFTSVGKEITEEAAQNLAKQGITNTIKDYAVTTGKTAGVEGLTESGQSFLERLQAGLNIADPSARAEYLDSFIGGAVLGGTLAPVGRYIERQKQVEEPLAPGQRPGESLEQTAQRLNFDIKQMTAPPEKSPFLSSTELASMATEENGYGKLVQYAERIKQEPDSPEKQASLEAAIELRKRVVSEAEARQTPTDKPYPFAEEPEKPIYLTGTGLIDLVNTKETPKDQLVSLLEYISKTKKDPESPERDQSVEQARTLYNLLQEEAKSRGFDLPEAFTLRATDLRAAGIPRTDPIYDQVKDKDLNKPDEADFVVKALEAAQKRATPDLYDKLEGVLDSIDRYLESRPGSGFYAQRTYPQPSGEGVAVAGRRAGEQPPAEGLAPSERGGVAPVTEPAEQPVPTTKVKPAPLKVAKPVPVPKPAPSTELIPTTVAPTAPVATTALSEQRALVPLNLSNMSLEQLEKAREDADTNNLKLDLAAIRKYLGEDAAKKYEGLSRRARENWWDKNATTELENESSVFRGVDEALIDEYIQAFNNFDTTSPKDLGRSIALLVRDIDKPNFIGSPSYVTLRNAVAYAKQQGWKEEEVTGAMRQRASEWAGADAKELFKNLFATTKKLANEPIVIDVEARVVEETIAPQIALLPQPDVATLEKHYGSKSNTAEFLQKVKNDVVLFATKGSNAVAAAIRSIIKKIHAGVLSVALIFNPGSINFPESYVVVPKVPAAATEVVETPSKQTVIELATVPDNVEGMSDAAKQAYETLIPSLKDKIGDKLIVIADKPGARVFVFKPDGTLVTQNKALFGAAKGDLYKGNVDVPENRVTPAGLFGLKLIDAAKGRSAKITAGEYDFGKVFALNDPEAVITIMHSVWLKDADASRRKAALANQNITDSRYSYGCINVDRDTYKFLLDNYESQMDGAKLFVVPDNQEQVKEFLAGKISQNLGGAKAGEGPDRLVRESVKKSLAKVAPQVSEAKFKELEAKAAKPSEAKPPEEKVRAPELQEKIDQLQGVLSKILAKYGLKDVKINLEEGMADEGSYSGQLIKLALDLDNPVRTLRHEAIHALKELGFFTPQQWKVLTDRAQKEWIEKYLKGQKAVVDGKEMTRYDAYMQLYDGDMEAIVEESIADAFADFSKTQPPAGMMRAILNRMQNLFKAIKQAMNVGGYDTAEDVFGAVEKGELPAPPSVAKAAPEQKKASLRSPIGLYSELENKLEAVDAKQAPAAQWKTLIKALPQKGVKPEEIEWSGVNDWLDLQAGKVKKEDLLDYLRANGVQVEEVVLGGRTRSQEGLTRQIDELRDKIIAAKEEFQGSGYLFREIRGDKMLNDLPFEWQLKYDKIVNQQEILDDLEKQRDNLSSTEPSKYGSYTLPFGTNYREVLLTLPKPIDVSGYKITGAGNRWYLRGPDNQILEAFGSEAEAQAKLNSRAADQPDVYRSSHWDQPNVIAHIRLNDRTDADGNKVLFVEEIQSDWGQEGKKKGFVSDGKLPAGWEVVEDKVRAYPGGPVIKTQYFVVDNTKTQVGLYGDTREKAIASATQRKGFTGGIPAAPFVTKTEGWLNLALKRVMVMAAEGGYDKVAFVNGDQSAGRYDLSKQVSRIVWNKKTGDFAAQRADYAGARDDRPPIRYSNVDEKKLEELIGKEAAKKLIDAEEIRGYRGIAGDDLKVGGEGMKAFYDKIVPNTVKNLLPKVGGEQMKMVAVSMSPEFKGPEAPAAVSEQPGFDVTPSMTEKVTTTGLPKFSLRAPKKLVTQRIPELQEAASKVAAGEMTPQEYGELANSPKFLGTIAPFDFIPLPASDDDAETALDKAKIARWSRVAQIDKGSEVGLRLDIPAYQNHGVWINSIHQSGEPVKYAAVAAITNAEFPDAGNKALRVAQGEAKSPFAVIKGNWKPVSLPQAVAQMKRAFQDPAWTQVGYNPLRHSYFFDRSTGNPVSTADEVIQIGPLVLAKNAVIESPETTIPSGERKYKFSLRAPDTPQFKSFLGQSKIVNADGSPKLMYHGTAQDITEFRPKQAGAIFVTDNPKFAETFASMSAEWMAKHADQFLTAEQFKEGKARAVEQIKKDYKADPKLRDKIIDGLNNEESLYRSEALEILGKQFKDMLPSGPNIMPVYIRAENPFDYENKDHINAIKEVEALLRYTPDSISDKLGAVKRGSWEAIESKSIQDVIKSLGFDGFYTKELDNKNLAVYSPSQIKSATGNEGTFDFRSPDIRKSLRPLPTLSSDVTDRIKATIVPRYRAGYVERILDAISPKQFSKFRKEFINRYDIQAKFDREAARQIKLMGGKEQLADAKAEPAALFADLGGGLAAAAMGVNDRKGGIPVYVKKYVVEKDFLELSSHNTKAAADAAAKKVPGAKVYEQGYTKVMDKAEGLLPIFQQLATYAKPKPGEPDVYSQYQFWADVKRTSKFILNPGTGRYEERLFEEDDIKRAKAIQEAYPEFVEIQKKWRKYNDGLVDFMRDTGVISAAGAEQMKKHGDYFPLYRHLGEDDIQGPRLFTSIANVQGPKAAKGSESEVTDFFETIVRNTQSAIQAGIKNIAARRATDQAMRIGEVVKLDRPQSGPTVYRVLEDGKETYYQARDPMFIESLKSLYQPDIPFIGLLSTPARILRNLVTKDPAFQLANMMRDSLSAYVASGFKFTPIVATLKQYAKAIADKSPEMRELRSAGVIGGYDYSQGVETSARKLEAEIRKAAKARTTMEKLTSPATSLWGALEKSSEASDSATRQEIYKKVLEQTGNEAEALYQALEIMNFNRKGRSPIIRILTAAVPFMNARIQGLDVLYRSGMRPLSGDATDAEKKRMNTFWVRGMMLMALSSMYWLLTHDDEEYKAQEQETRDNYWLFPSAGVKIPIPFEIGVMFKVIPERILEYSFGSDTGKDFLKSMERQVVSTFAFNLIPQTFLPAYEVKTNYSFFTQRPIITPGMENISPEYQVGPNTSKVSGAIGQALNISPIKLDYLIQGYTGTMGMYAVNLFDAFFSMNDEAPKASRRLEQMPVLRRFMVDPEARGSISAYYDLKNSVDEVVRTSNFLQRSMDFENYGKYMQENVQMLAVKDYINDLEKTMKEYREMKNLVRISNMDADSKRDTLSNIGKLEQQLTKNIQTLKKQIASQ